MSRNLTPEVEAALGSVTAERVKALRETSGEGMMRCKAILAEKAFNAAIPAARTKEDMEALVEVADTIPKLQALMGVMIRRL